MHSISTKSHSDLKSPIDTLQRFGLLSASATCNTAMAGKEGRKLFAHKVKWKGLGYTYETLEKITTNSSNNYAYRFSLACLQSMIRRAADESLRASRPLVKRAPV
uniref:Transposase n=1 Tax=Heterorhabditis bacteriophora TaxID=37862 RepID=A0A1I7WV50_HETBA